MGNAVELIGVHGGDLLVVNAARVSYARWSDALTARDAQLVRRLAREGHLSPFYHPQATLRVTAPIYVARQLHRHHIGLALNEVSRRYTSRDIQIRMPDLGGYTRNAIAEDIEISSQAAYERLLFDGVAPELARAVLPQATLTTWLWTGSLYAYWNLCRQRLAEDAQAETRAVAVEIDAIMAAQFPVSWTALREAGLPPPDALRPDQREPTG